MLFYALFLIFWYKSHKCHDYSVSLSDSGYNIRDAVHISLYYYSLLMCHYIACILLFTLVFLSFYVSACLPLLSFWRTVNADAKKMTVNSSQKIPCDEFTVWRVHWLPNQRWQIVVMFKIVKSSYLCEKNCDFDHIRYNALCSRYRMCWLIWPKLIIFKIQHCWPTSYSEIGYWAITHKLT